MTAWLDSPRINLPTSLDSLDLNPLVAQALYRRGMTDPASVHAFLHPDEIPGVPYPDLEMGNSGGIKTALDRLQVAKRKGETICVWGDFDVDGQTSTALLVQALRSLGMHIVHYIPIRGRESHGLHIESLAPILDKGVTLLLTCDTGITAHEAVDYSNSRGVDVILTDHHELGESLPNARAILNPKMLPAGHLLTNLAGVGVAYKLADALLDSATTSAELLDLVALGLIADVAILRGETRSLAWRGIQCLRRGMRPGLKAITDLAGVNFESLTEETISFTFAPRLNALGRLGDANPAVELLLTQDHSRARILATQIEGLNAQRRLLTSQVYDAAEAVLRSDPGLLKEPAIVLSHPGWPGGVVGIVANKLVERHHKPAILLTKSENGILRGSARSLEGLNITQAIATQKDLLSNFGGHPMAAGLSLPFEKLEEFRRGLGKAIEAQLGQIAHTEPALEIDAWVQLEEIDIQLAQAFEDMAPFGAGNPPLTLAAHQVTLKAAREIGKNKEHLRLNIEDLKGNNQSLLWWGGAGEKLPEEGSKIDVAWSLRAGSYRGQKQVTLNFIDYRIIEEPPLVLRPRDIEVIDHRVQGHLKSIDPAALVWAEGTDRDKGKTRFELTTSEVFVIYTAPPSPAELRQAMDIVKPRQVYVFAFPSEWDEPDAFLNRLAGLCKFALNQRAGKAALPGLAGAMAATQRAVEVGLQWINASGQMTLTVEMDQVSLSPEKTERNPILQDELLVALRGILKETSAYRKFFKTAENIKSLL